MKQKPRYFIYARKSSEGSDRQILSIESQIKELNHIIARDNLTVVDIYTESKSAHIPKNRPGYNDMLSRIKKGEADGIITWHINRISRNPLESGEIQQMLQDGKIKEIITPYRHFRTEDNAILFSIETSEANQYSRDLSINVKRGLKQKYELGHPPSIAPLGYLNTKSNIRGSNQVIVDPDRWPIVRKGFELMLSGIYTVTQVLYILNNEFGLTTRPGNSRGGKPLSKSGFYRILINPFYYGYFYRNGVLYKGSYKPIITAEEYDQIQLILGRKGKPRTQKHQFAFTGFIKCGVCGSSITASEKKKFIKSIGKLKTYTFYHCTHRKKGASSCSEKYFLPVGILEENIIEELGKYEMNQSFREWAISVAKENSQFELEKQNHLIAELQNNELRIRRELNNLIDLRISNGISEEIYFQKKAEKENQLIRVQSQNQKLEQNASNWLEELENKFKFAENIIERFKNGSLTTKKQICLDFGWNWILKAKKLNVSKHEWLLPLRKYRKAVEETLSRLEPKITLTNKDQTDTLDSIRPLVCALINEVRTVNAKYPKSLDA